MASQGTARSSFCADGSPWRYDGYAIHQVGGAPGGECFLLVPDEGPAALFDCGFAFSAQQTADNIEAALDGRALGHIVLTHSHYDHCAGATALRTRFPDATVVASAHAARVLERPSALSTMTQLDDAHADSCAMERAGELAPLAVGTVLGEGDELAVGNMEFAVLAAPGHTKCCLAFWCADAGLLVSCETSGVYSGPVPAALAAPDAPDYLVVVPSLTGYGQSMDYIVRCAELGADVLLSPHWGPFEGERASKFIDAAAYWGKTLRTFVMECAAEGLDVERIVARYVEAFYVAEGGICQPRQAFELNASYIVPTVLAECAAQSEGRL